jgi:organic hydroperoxide reductase OsmC/OhrA
MSEHVAEVVWERGDVAPGDDYSRSHVWRFDGGVEVPAASAPALHGDPTRVDPEEAFVASISSCHMLWFLHLAGDAGFHVRTYADHAVGHMNRVDRGVIAITDVELHPRIEWVGDAPDDTTIAELHDESHHRCFIANSVTSNITVHPPAD